MLCSVILQNVNFALDDPNNTKFSLTQKILAINSALQALVSYRPDAASYTTMMLLVAGTRQTLPIDGVRLLKAGRAIRKADMLVQDALIPDWHETTGQTVVDEYFYDSITPKDFYVYPPAPVSPIIGVDISYVRVLPTITADTDAFPVDDYFASAIQEWMLYLLWGGDDKQNQNYADARSHLSTFFQLLQIKASSDGAVNPKSKG
jgi:hypothetical protein